MTEKNSKESKRAGQSSGPSKGESNIGNPTRGAQVAAGDKATAPEAAPSKPLSRGMPFAKPSRR
jgi:hypothetical protein